MDMQTSTTHTAAQHTIQPRSSVLRQALRDQSRVTYHEAILASAEKIIFRDGFKRTKMVDVAEATGVSVGTLYNYFESKEAVLQAIIEQHYARLDGQLELSFDSEDPVERVVQFVTRFHHFIEESRDLFQLYYRSELDRLDTHKVWASLSPNAVIDRISPRMAQLLEQCLQLGHVRGDIPLNDLAWSLCALLQALLVEWFRCPDGFSLTQRATQLTTLFFSGACAAHGSATAS